MKSWMSDYFNSSANYEDSNSLYFNTDFRLGDSVLDEWEDSTITDMYNENVDDPNDRAINVEDMAIISGLANGSTDESIVDVKTIAEDIRKLIRNFVRKGYSIREATKWIFNNYLSKGDKNSQLWELIARNEGNRVREKMREQEIAKTIRKRNKRWAAEMAKHPQKHLRLPKHYKSYNPPSQPQFPKGK